MSTIEHKCNHKCELHIGSIFTFSAPVYVLPYTRENRAAHGGITYTEQCAECAAIRDVNANGRHVEVSSWRKPARQA